MSTALTSVDRRPRRKDIGLVYFDQLFGAARTQKLVETFTELSLPTFVRWFYIPTSPSVLLVRYLISYHNTYTPVSSPQDLFDNIYNPRGILKESLVMKILMVI